MSSQPRLQIVDDFATMRRILHTPLNGMSYGTAEAAEDGAVTMSMFRASKYDFVVPDINMPGVNGFELPTASSAMGTGTAIRC